MCTIWQTCQCELVVEFLEARCGFSERPVRSIVLMAVSICLCLPMNYYPLGQILNGCTWRERDSDCESATMNHRLSAAVVLGCVLVIAVFVSDISVIFDVTGSSASALLVYLLPCIFWLRLHGKAPSQGATS